MLGRERSPSPVNRMTDVCENITFHILHMRDIINNWKFVLSNLKLMLRKLPLMNLLLEFFLNEFYRIYRICRIWKIFLQKSCIRTHYLLCNKPGCYHSASTTHVGDRNCKLNPIHASVIYHFPWIHWIQRKFCSFKKNSISLMTSII